MVPDNSSENIVGQKGLKQYESEIQEKYKCKICTRIYTWNQSLLRHERITHGECPVRFKFDFYGFVSKRKEHLLYHIKCKHLQNQKKIREKIKIGIW